MKRDYDCYLEYLYVGCIVYAGDVILLSVSVGGLWKMLDFCIIVRSRLEIVFSAAKSSF